MSLKYLFFLALCITVAIAYRTRENDNQQRRLQRSDQDNSLVDSLNYDGSSLEEDALVDPLPDDTDIPKENPKWGKNRKNNRRWRKKGCRYGNKTEGAAEDGENNNEQSEVKCERYRNRGWRRRGNKDKKDSNEEDQNENKHDRYHHHHHHHCRGNKTESDDSVHGQDGNFERHHHGWRKHGRRNQTDEQDENQIENEEGKRERHRHRGYHHRGNKNENGEFVHDPEWHKHHNFSMPEGNVGRRGHHHHHHHHHCHNRTTTTSTTPTPPSSSDDQITNMDVRADVE